MPGFRVSLLNTADKPGVSKLIEDLGYAKRFTYLILFCPKLPIISTL